MSKLRSVNFSNLCRVCTSSDDQKVDVFSNENKSRNLCAKANECLPLNMDESDRLPKMLCYQCVQNVESFMAFRNLCRNSQTKLSGWLNMATDKITLKETKTVSSVCDTRVPDSNCTTYNNLINNFSTSTTSTNLQPNVLTIQSSNASNTNLNSNAIPITVTGVPPLASLGGNNDLTNSIMQTITIQPTQNHFQDQQQSSSETEKEKHLKNNSIQEFLKLKPNLKVTTVNKKCPQQQQNIQHQHNQQQDQLQLQQLQQQLQMQLQQLQQQQLQQQLQLLTAQIHPQQITITTPGATLTPMCTNGTILNGNSSNSNGNICDSSVSSLSNSIHTLSGDNDDNNNSTNRNKKPKINFVITPPNNNQALNNSAAANHFSTIPSHPQIQLQLQTPQNQPQQIQTSNTGSFLSNLAPLLQQQSQGTTLNAVFQNQPMLQASTSNATTMLPSNKCYLPITIRDESTDQQFVAHIDAKNFILPTTYQLQMKLQPQIATADGQPIMQLAPTSIPATLQITPQNIPTGQSLTPTALTAFGSNLLSSAGQLISIQPSLQQNCQPQQFINIQQELLQSEQQQQKQTKVFNRNLVSSNLKEHTKGDELLESNKLKGFQTTNGNKLKMIPQTINNSDDMETGNNFSQQIMQQIQQQESFDNISTIQTQHGGVTVHRVKATPPSIANSTALTILNKKSPTQMPQTKIPNTNISKLPIINKQNITISRITPQSSVSTVIPTTKGGQVHQSQINNNKLNCNTGELNGEAAKTLQTTVMTGVGKKNVRPITNHVPSNNVSTSLEMASTMQNAGHSNEVISTNQNTRPLSKTKSVCEPAPPKRVYKRMKSNEVDVSIAQQPNKIIMVDNEGLDLAKSSKHTIVVTSKSSYANPVKSITKKVATNDKVDENLNRVAETNSMPITASAITLTTSKLTSTTSRSTPSNDLVDSTFQCLTCNRTFKKKELLTQHVKLHAGVRPFKCTEEGCQKAFSRKEHLLRHLISHTGKKMFSCDFCQKPFSRKDNLSKHRKAHTDPGAINTYICNICNKSFAVKSYYEQHKLKHQKMIIKNDTDNKECKELVLAVKQASTANMLNGNNNSMTTTATMPRVTNYDESQIIIQQPQQSSHQIMHLQLPSSIVSTATNNLVGNTITITEAYSGNNNQVNYKNLQGNNNNNSIHDATVLNLPSSLASFVQQAQIVDSATGQIMGHVKIQK